MSKERKRKNNISRMQRIETTQQWAEWMRNKRPKVEKVR